MAIDLDALENVGAVHARAERRRWQMLLHGFAGVPDLDELKVNQPGAGNRSVDVTAGGCFVGSSARSHGLYPIYSTATVNVPISARNTGATRIDSIVAQILDTEYGDITNLQAIGVIVGSASPPVLPTRTLEFARVSVANAATTIVTANITDRRRPAGLGATAARAFATGVTTLVDGSVFPGFFTPVLLAGENYDYTSLFASNQYVCASGGLYEISGRVSVGGFANQAQRLIASAFVDGVEAIRGSEGRWEAAAGSPICGSVFHDTIALAFGQVVSLRCFQDTGANLSINNEIGSALTYLSVMRIA